MRACACHDAADLMDAGDGENLPVIDGNPDKEPDPYGGDESAKFNPWTTWDD